jgi:hypothetical protein
MTHLPALEVLIERCEAAQGPDRELDLLLAQTFVPDVVVLRRNDDDTGNEPHTYWEYSGSVDAALALAERLLPGCAWAINGGAQVVPSATVWPASGAAVEADGNTSVLAFLVATLRSLTKLEG